MYQLYQTGYSDVPSIVTPASISGHTQISGLVPLFLPLLYIPGGSHSQQVAYPSPPHQTLENPGVPFHSSCFSAPFFWKAVKMFRLFWSSSFFPSLILFFSISLVIDHVFLCFILLRWCITLIFRY